MPKKKLYCVVDVESAGDLGFPLIYDFAWKIVDKQGNVYAKENYLVREVFTNMKLMTEAYYAEKYWTVYPDLLANGLKILPLEEIIQRFRDDWKEFNVTTFCAYNAGFDLTAMLCTWLHGNKEFGLETVWPKMHFRNAENSVCLHEQFEKFGEYLAESDQMSKDVRKLKKKVCFDTEILDIYRLCAERLMATKGFQKTALENLWLTPNGNFSTTAECAWRYFSKEYDFIEHHTSMEDVEIETELLLAMLKQKKKIPYNSLDPACIISRCAQPENRYFHERQKQTWSDFLEDSFSVTLGFTWIEFLAMDNFNKWKVILKDSFLDMPISEFQRKKLADRFLSTTGMTWKAWQKLPDNFKKRLLIDLYGGQWYSFEENTEKDLPDFQQQRVEKEIARIN